MRADREDFHAFAQGHVARLQRIAYLLCGDADQTIHVVEDALARAWGHWRQVEDGETPERLVLRSLARAAMRVSTVPPVVPVDPEDAAAARRDRLWNSLRDLTRQERAALVLAHLPNSLAPTDVDLIEILGRHRAAQWHASALERLTPDGDDPDLLIRQTLAERSEEPFSSTPSIEHALHTQRLRSRRSVLALGAGIAVTAAGSALALQRRSSATREAPLPTPADSIPARRDLTPPLPWPVRGNLAGDTDAINALRVDFASSYRNVAGGIQILYAADLASGRIVLAAGRLKDTQAIFAWGHAKNGSEPMKWFYQGHQHLDRQALLLPNFLTVMAVVQPPGATADVSWRPSYPPDGTVVRTFEPLPLDNGAAVVALGFTPWELVRVRVSEGMPGDQQLVPAGVTTVTPWLDWTPSDGMLAAAHGSPDPNLVQQAFSSLVFTLGLDTFDQLSPRVIWGEFEGGTNAVYLHATLRSGGDFRVLSYNGRLQSWVVPRGAPDFPVAWSNFYDSGSAPCVLAGPNEIWADLVNPFGDSVRQPVRVAPYSVEELAIVSADGFELVLRDRTGVVLQRPLYQLPGPGIAG